ncbi:hypothetical protein F5J12DRAFT_718605, partial [Pisolithus orientalis]|uniref:uncharacterized protein n=1 Tax=Pisolithus orientalis TaxID=936130 RepID=UPI0022257A01
VVPVLLGDSIPLPWRPDYHMEESRHAMFLLFLAWQNPSELLQGYLCWTEAFNAYDFSDAASLMISNFLIELKCKDAKDVI